MKEKRRDMGNDLYLAALFLFTRATSQSPCLHETLATAAITTRKLQSNFLVVAEVSICAWLTYAKKEYIKRMRNN